MARRRIIASLLEQFLHRSYYARLLDIGGGTGDLTDVLTQFGRVVRVDYLEEGLVLLAASPNLLSRRRDTSALILALDLLEHLDDDGARLSEFHRVLKPGGSALVTVPAFRFLWGRLDDIAHHNRGYARAELCAKVKCVGFRVFKSSYLNTLLFSRVAFARRTQSLRTHWTKADAVLNMPPEPVNAALATLWG